MKKMVSRFWVLTAVVALLALSLAGCGSSATNAPAATAAPAATVAPAATLTAQAAKLNLNTASGDEFLAGVPNMGSRMVREFLEYRPYASILQFL